MNRFVCLLLLFATPALYAQRYNAVAEKSTITFAVKNFGLTVEGKFTGIAGEVKFTPAEPEASAVKLVITTNTLDTDNNLRNKHLKKEEYFDVEKYPQLRFTSTAIKKSGAEWMVTGKLTIKDVTREVSFPFVPMQTAEGYSFSGTLTLNRRDYHVGGGSLSMADTAEIKFVLVTKADKGT